MKYLEQNIKLANMFLIIIRMGIEKKINHDFYIQLSLIFNNSSTLRKVSFCQIFLSLLHKNILYVYV